MMTEQKQVPVWHDYLRQMPTSQIDVPYAPGTKTMQHKEMDSANRRHAAEMSLGRDKLSLQKWEAQMRLNLNMMEFEALKAARSEEQGLKRDYYDLERERWEHERDQYSQPALDSRGQPTLSGGYLGGMTPGQAVTDFSVRDVFDATTRDDRMKYVHKSPHGF